MTTPAVKCFCERPARIATSNTTANPGRQFELCATGECAYWAWCDNEGIGDFARCTHPENDLRCGFFMWCDGQDSQELFNEHMDARM
ncbi:hypothetical protein B0H17DRAFT_1077302 [Mycena rosella]|uniref:GRF-type domain-containing protein n=1 Tax=Mycena rosella TaxID=1033263 RepID=A0AAD7D650_MYCRO|nr:hypothetical protein B0H17DRAFT_1077302 [Mycena rosella]